MHLHLKRYTSMMPFYRTSIIHNCATGVFKGKLLQKIQLDALKLGSVRSNTSQTEQSTIISTSIIGGSEKTRGQPKKSISSAMKHYLEKKKDHDVFIARERSEFELGKKHLANMMGMSYEAMTQEDIDKAIAYLFPSGLYNPEARPLMKPPEEVCKYKIQQKC